MSDQIHADLQTAGRLMIERGLPWTNTGNISTRSGRDMFLITASGASAVLWTACARVHGAIGQRVLK